MDMKAILEQIFEMVKDSGETSALMMLQHSEGEPACFAYVCADPEIGPKVLEFIEQLEAEKQGGQP